WLTLNWSKKPGPNTPYFTSYRAGIDMVARQNPSVQGLSFHSLIALIVLYSNRLGNIRNESIFGQSLMLTERADKRMLVRVKFWEKIYPLEFQFSQRSRFLAPMEQTGRSSVHIQ